MANSIQSLSLLALKSAEQAPGWWPQISLVLNLQKKTWQVIDVPPANLLTLTSHFSPITLTLNPHPHSHLHPHPNTALQKGRDNSLMCFLD